MQKAQKQGYRSRAAYKLLEINERDRLFRRGMTVVDLGAAPGGWSQVAIERIAGGQLLAVDLLSMDPIEGVDFIRGDLNDDNVLAALIEFAGQSRVDLVICDIAPNSIGIKSADQARSMGLAELAADTAMRLLKLNGAFLIKVFQGEGFDEFRKNLAVYFEKVYVRKPKASRDQSREVYILARGYKDNGECELL